MVGVVMVAVPWRHAKGLKRFVDCDFVGLLAQSCRLNGFDSFSTRSYRLLHNHILNRTRRLEG